MSWVLGGCRAARLPPPALPPETKIGRNLPIVWCVTQSAADPSLARFPAEQRITGNISADGDITSRSAGISRCLAAKFPNVANREITSAHGKLLPLPNGLPREAVLSPTRNKSVRKMVDKSASYSGIRLL